MRHIIVLVFILILFSFLTFAFIKRDKLLQAPLPNYEENLVLNNLLDSVAVFRDNYGTPHIYAKNEQDLYYATGYIMAQERLWQMDLLRRVTIGKVSEIFGDDFVDTDWLLRALQFSKKSEQILDSLNVNEKTSLGYFAKGVNQYINDYRDKLPIEFKILGYSPENWTEVHSLNLIGYMAWDLKAGWKQLLIEQLRQNIDSALLSQILPTEAMHTTTVFGEDEDRLLANNKLLVGAQLDALGLDIFSGSNNWAVNGKKSNNGKPLLANDMHISFGVPGIWMQMHQHVEGKIHVSGLALPGAPLIVVGHNDSIAWGMTNTYVDNLDLYLEKINPLNSMEYQYNEEWLDFKVQKETINSKSGSSFTREIKHSIHGSIVSEIKGIKNKVISMRWVGNEYSNEYRAIYKVNRAHNWNMFREAFKDFKAISQNIAYADVQGNIGLQTCAGVPIRNRDIKIGLLPGWNSKYDWQGYIPFEALPTIYNPENGMVSSANNKTTQNDYPYHIGSWYSLPYRIDRIRELLETKDTHSTASFAEIQTDIKSKQAAMLQNVVAQLDFSETDMDQQELLKSYLNWNCEMTKESWQAYFSDKLAFEITRKCLTQHISDTVYKMFRKNAKLMKIAFYRIINENHNAWIDNPNTSEKESIQQITKTCINKILSELTDQYGSDTLNWQWGFQHTLTLKHPLSKVEALNKVFKLNANQYSVPGSYHTVAPYSYPFFQPSNIVHGASNRCIYNLNNWDSSYVVIPTGNSGLPGSPFYCDQTKLFANGEYKFDYFSKKAVEANAKYLQYFLSE